MNQQALGADDLQHMGGLFSSIGKGFKAIGKAVGKVATSGPFKTVLGGVAMVFPPAAAALPAIAIAGRVLDAAQGKSGTKAQQAAAKRTIANTAAAAKQGDPGALRATGALVGAAKIRQVANVTAAKRPVVNTTGTAEPGWHVSRAGRITRVGV
jgi:hypothetical protein